MKLVKAGKAVISSGGVREKLTGKMIEMAKPTAISKLGGTLSGLNPLMSGLNLASSIGSNVQCAFIQAGVDQANAKLDDVLVQLGNISKALGGLQTVQVLSWVNTAFSLANCGISVAGFYMTLTKLNGIKEQLQEFYDRYKMDRQHDKIQQFNRIMDDLKSDLGMMQNRAVNDTFTEADFRHADPSVTRLINEAKAYIEAIIDDFEHGNIDGQIACQIIFTLAAVLSQTINEFCSQYYFIHHMKHHMYDEWVSFLDKIDNEVFRQTLKNHLQLDPAYVGLTPAQKAGALMVSLESIKQEKARLATCATVVTELTEQEYFNLEDTINQKIYLEMPKTMSDLIGCDLDKLLEKQIMEMAIPETGEDEPVLVMVN